MAKKTTAPEPEAVREADAALIPVTVSVNGDELSFHVRPSLPLSARIQMVMEIADLVFLDGAYFPTVEEFAFRSTVLSYCTDLPLADMSIDEIDRLCQCGDILHKVYELSADPLSSMRSDAEKLIQWRKDKLLRAKSDELYDAVTSVVNRLDSLLDQLEGADLGKIDELTELARAVAAKSEKELGHGIIEFRETQKAAETAPKKRAVRKKPAPADAAKPESGE